MPLSLGMMPAFLLLLLQTKTPMQLCGTATSSAAEQAKRRGSSVITFLSHVYKLLLIYNIQIYQLTTFI
jgi:hypothetical protein